MLSLGTAKEILLFPKHLLIHTARVKGANIVTARVNIPISTYLCIIPQSKGKYTSMYLFYPSYCYFVQVLQSYLQNMSSEVLTTVAFEFEFN